MTLYMRKEDIRSFFKGNWQSFYLKYLPNAKKTGGQEFKARCPFHEERNPSFQFNNDTGKYFCHGCQSKGDGFRFYAKMNGLNDRREFQRILKGIASEFNIPSGEQKSRIVKTYDYTDPEGNLLFQVCRMEPKGFRQRRPDGKGGWIWDLKGIQPVLYRLPEVSKAKEVIVCEGEKDADNLAALGMAATTCPMGAKKWRHHYNECLRGKDIVLIPDNDDQGREHMTQVARSLDGICASLKWIDLPGLPPKGDVSDWIATFKNIADAGERLSVMIEGADFYTPPKKATLEDAVLDVVAFKELPLPPKEKLLNPWVTEQMIGLIYGWRGVGKTFFVMSILNAVSKGEAFGPWEAIHSVPCLFLDGEMPPQDIQRRLQELNPGENPGNRLYIYSDALANSLGLIRAHLGNEAWRHQMKTILLGKGVKLWAIDNLASLAGGLDENKKQDWDPINAWLLELRFAGISTLMLHHESKTGKQRGTAAREDNIDISIRLKAPMDYTPEDGARFIAHFEKSRLSPEDLPLITDTEFRLEQDGDGLRWSFDKVKLENRRAVLQLIEEGLDQKSIGGSLDLSKGYVSKIVKQAREEGFLTPGGELTQAGHMEAYGL